MKFVRQWRRSARMAVRRSGVRQQEPPRDLHARDLPIIELTGKFRRIHQTALDPLLFGKTAKNRFDDPKAASGDFGSLYLALDHFGAFIESFGDSEGNTISHGTLDQRSIAEITTTKVIRAVDLTAQGAAWLGAAGEVSAGNHALSQRWAYALWGHPASPEGIYYRARHDQSRFCAAIFDRAQTSITVVLPYASSIQASGLAWEPCLISTDSLLFNARLPLKRHSLKSKKPFCSFCNTTLSLHMALDVEVKHPPDYNGDHVATVTSSLGEVFVFMWLIRDTRLNASPYCETGRPAVRRC